MRAGTKKSGANVEHTTFTPLRGSPEERNR